MINESTEKFMLTTIDNPFNPWVKFDEWLQFDMEKGYNTCGLLARMNSNISDELDEIEQTLLMNDAIQRVLTIDIQGIYMAVKPNDRIIPISVETLNANLLNSAKQAV